MRHRASALTLLSAAALFLLGCSGHEDRVRTALDALDRHAPDEAIASLDEEMEVKTQDDLPALNKDNALLLLDRASIQLSLNRYHESARDFGVADKAIDVLDLSRNAVDDIGKYLFSDDAGPYKAPPYEKLMINTVNIVNYLAVGDLSGAKVEARRLAIIQKYVKDHEDVTGLLGIGSYLAGFSFEKAGDRDEALAFYDDALRYAQYPSLQAPLRVLTHGEKRTPGIDALVLGAGAPSIEETGEAEVIVVIGFGRVPQKIPVRLPIGLALTIVAADISPRDNARANELAAKGLVTWINFPELGPSRGGYSTPTFTLDGRPQALEEALDVEAQVRADWEKKKPTVILSAITRMIARMVAGEVAEGAGKAAAGKDGSPVGVLVGLLTTATLAAVDTPDTRCWSTLPSRIAIARIRTSPGKHAIRLGARGMVRDVNVDLRPGGWAVVPMMALR